jgi:hypothetical protein
MCMAAANWTGEQWPLPRARLPACDFSDQLGRMAAEGGNFAKTMLRLAQERDRLAGDRRSIGRPYRRRFDWPTSTAHALAQARRPRCVRYLPPGRGRRYQHGTATPHHVLRDRQSPFTAGSSTGEVQEVVACQPAALPTSRPHAARSTRAWTPRQAARTHLAMYLARLAAR